MVDAAKGLLREHVRPHTERNRARFLHRLRQTARRGVNLEETMQNLSEIMTRDVRVIPPSSTVQEAAEQMRQEDVGAIPVCDGRKLIGVITDRDIAVRSSARGQDPKSTRVTDVMSDQVVWCFDDATVSDVARVMQDKQVRRIPVVDRDKQLVGIVALADLATSSVSEGTKSTGLKGVSEPR
jgi:CBS domain-containing protein